MVIRYEPVVDGFSQRDAQVRYCERLPPKDLADVVHVFRELPHSDRSGEPATRAAEIGCARGSAAPMAEA